MKLSEEGSPARPVYVPGHGLLRDKVVVVTAAAGAGIGGRVRPPGARGGRARSSLSDAHERRLAEARQALAQEFGATGCRALPCDVTVEEQVQALFDAAEERSAAST